MASGLVGQIRNSTTSEQFDLGGYSEPRAIDLIKGAFSTPLEAPTEMIRFTFVVGGGKLVRSRYDEDMTRWLCGALREIGFVEDKSAAETFDSQGTFKQQHDTGQNLKYLIVYPRVSCAERKAESPAAEVLDTQSKEYVVAASTLDLFKTLVAAKTQSWRQKKAMLKVLVDGHEAFKGIEAKLMTGLPLTPQEQAVYEANSGQDDEKIAWLQAEVKNMADHGGLTQSERRELLETLAGNAAAVDEEIAKAREEGAVKKAEKLVEKKAGILARRSVIDKAEVVVHRLKHGEEVRKLRLRLLPLLALEEKGRSMSLTLADLKTLEEKSELEESIAALEGASRGWFLADEDFQAMCKLEADEAAKKYSAQVKAKAVKTKSGSGTQGKALSSASSWATIGTGRKPAAVSSNKSGGAKSALSAAFDSDSD